MYQRCRRRSPCDGGTRGGVRRGIRRTRCLLILQTTAIQLPPLSAISVIVRRRPEEMTKRRRERERERERRISGKEGVLRRVGSLESEEKGINWLGSEPRCRF